jgi:hypothetical protein
VNLGASLLERDLVHHKLHEPNPTTMLRFEVFDSQGIRNGARIEPLTLVCHDQRDSVPDLAAAADVNQLVCIQPIAMNDCVIQGFPERQLDRVFLASDAMRPFDEPHQPFHQR